jgi:hypothetical protein
MDSEFEDMSLRSVLDCLFLVLLSHSFLSIYQGDLAMYNTTHFLPKGQARAVETERITRRQEEKTETMAHFPAGDRRSSLFDTHEFHSFTFLPSTLKSCYVVHNKANLTTTSLLGVPSSLTRPGVHAYPRAHI